MGKIAPIIAIMGLLLLIIEALHLGVADLHRVGAVLRLESWNKTAKFPSYEEWQKSQQSLQTAMDLDPDNPDHKEDMARLFKFKSFKSTAKIIERDEKSLEYLRSIIPLKPASAYLWARLARAKIAAKQMDEQTWQAMRSAIVAAPNDYPIQLAIGKLSLITWPWIPNRWRGPMQSSLQKSLKGKTRPDIIRFAKLNNKLKLANHLCRGCDVLQLPK
ncbi:MAG: hypothetical protein HQL69_03505 [Magnetococcales bacterium]|nr:hypothetical protein [Magnetococcales bacterium]